MTKEEITQILELFNVDTRSIEMVQFAYDQGAKHPDPQQPKCNPHSRAPHGFAREASHQAGRYVCDCESWDAYEAGREDGVQAMLHLGYGDNPNPLTATEIVDCATATYQCDPNDVTENDIKFARHIERMTLERQ
jgi:hypothetical protein